MARYTCGNPKCGQEFDVDVERLKQEQRVARLGLGKRQEPQRIRLTVRCPFCKTKFNIEVSA